MAKTIDILEIERKRIDTGDFATIHLFIEGPVLPNLQFGSREYEHLQCGNE
jgi:hypothetical protein